MCPHDSPKEGNGDHMKGKGRKRGNSPILEGCRLGVLV